MSPILVFVFGEAANSRRRNTSNLCVCDQGGGLLFNDAPLVVCWEVANCRQQALIICVVDATFLFVDSSPKLLVVHVATHS